MLTDPELHAITHRLMLSETMQSLAAMAADCPVDLRDPESVKAALATSSHTVIQALDAKRIHFDRAEDQAMLYGLLMTALEVVMDGRLKENTRRTTMQ
jgi:hypothetical protein